MRSRINVIGVLWVGGEGTTTYYLSPKEIEDMKPITRGKMLKHINGKDFQAIIDAEGLFRIGEDYDEKDDILTCTCSFFRVPWQYEGSEDKFYEITFD